MSDEQINIAIAEACGWKHIAFNRGWIKAGDGETQCVIPNYCNDLNAMNEAEDKLEGMNKAEFAVQLCRVVGKDWPSGIGGGSFAHIHATAREKAEAFLRVKGKWEEASK
jgi:hypothetical protein